MESERIGPDLCLTSHTMIEAALTSFPPSKLLSNVRSSSANALQQQSTRVFTTQSYDPSHSRTTAVSVATTNRTMPSSPSLFSSSVDESGDLALENIRDSLIRQEDSIIFNLIERTQYKLNLPAYDKEAIPVPGFDGSLMEYILRETEILHGKVRRYTSPVEHPFFPHVIPPIILPPLSYPQALHSAGDDISVTPLVWSLYFDHLLPALCPPGDDANYGSSATMDVLCLQAIAKRIHFGKFVAEAKFREQPSLYEPLIKAQDAEGLLKLLTFEKVEKTVEARVELKTATFGQDVKVGGGSSAEASPPSHCKVDPSLVAELYGKWIMPLTKKVQVMYLLRRLDTRAQDNNS